MVELAAWFEPGVMPTPERVVQCFAEWSHAWADPDQKDTPMADWAQDYLNNYRVVYMGEGIVAIDMQLGAFDHGAGNGLLVWHEAHLVWFYEDSVIEIAAHKELRGLEPTPTDERPA